MKTKTYGIIQEDFTEFINEINKFSEKNQVIATQTHYAEGKWFAIIYYNPVRQEADTMQGQDNKVLPPIPPTPEQLEALKFYGIKEIPKSKKIAWEMINSIKLKRGEYGNKKQG